jgi:hypothetical protein
VDSVDLPRTAPLNRLGGAGPGYGTGVATRPKAEQDRLNRELIELLNELRVALPGVQVLFAFLLTVPFSQGFTRVTDFQKDAYFVALLLTTAACIFLIAPSAYHRITFRGGAKKRIIFDGNVLTLLGLVFLGLAMITVVMLISDVLFGPATVIVVTGLTASAFAGVWCALPALRTRGSRD